MYLYKSKLRVVAHSQCKTTSSIQTSINYSNELPPVNILKRPDKINKNFPLTEPRVKIQKTVSARSVELLRFPCHSATRRFLDLPRAHALLLSDARRRGGRETSGRASTYRGGSTHPQSAILILTPGIRQTLTLTHTRIKDRTCARTSRFSSRTQLARAFKLFRGASSAALRVNAQ